VKPGPIACPACHAEVARHSWFVTKRVREISCPHCGAHLEVVLPAWAHYLTLLFLGVIVEASGLVIVFLTLGRKWSWVALLVAALVVLEAARSAGLRQLSVVRWTDQGSVERRAAGRWVPE
jgi:uncharacterized protein (DUF983 family)